MEKTKYIPGDLVMSKIHGIGVIQVCSLGGNSVIVHYQNSDITVGNSIDSAEPIPLTPAILEANGWKRDGGQYRFSFTSYTGDKVELIGFFIEMFKDAHDMLKHRYFQITHESKVIYGCFYCHQLQHLLFGLGLPSDLKV